MALKRQQMKPAKPAGVKAKVAGKSSVKEASARVVKGASKGVAKGTSKVASKVTSKVASKVAAKSAAKAAVKGGTARRRPVSAGEELAALGAVERIVSIPDDVVLAPQAEAPRAMTAREGARRQAVRELGWKEFDRLVQGIAREVHKGFAPEAVVGVVHGGVFVGGAIASALSLEFYPVRISRRSRDKAGREGAPVARSEMPRELKGRRVLLVDDVASSGDTLELARAMLEKVKAAAVATATLVVKEEGYRPDYVALQSDALVVFPWDYELELPPGFGR